MLKPSLTSVRHDGLMLRVLVRFRWLSITAKLSSSKTRGAGRQGGKDGLKLLGHRGTLLAGSFSHHVLVQILSSMGVTMHGHMVAICLMGCQEN